MKSCDRFAGKDWQDKVLDVREVMKSKNASALVVTALDDVAWLLNLRGVSKLLSCTCTCTSLFSQFNSTFLKFSRVRYQLQPGLLFLCYGDARQHQVSFNFNAIV